MTDKIPPLMSEGLADGDPPNGAKLALARENIDALDRKLEEIAAELGEIEERVARGEPVKSDLAHQQAKLRKARLAVDRKRLIMAAYVDAIERSSS